MNNVRYNPNRFLWGGLVLFVAVANDLIAISIGFELKLGFIMLVFFALIIWLTIIASVSPTYYFDKNDVPILIWALLAVVLCVINGGIRNYVYTAALLVYLGMVLGAKAPWLGMLKFRVFDLYLLSGIIISAIGIGQFLIALLGLGDMFFVQQWWYEGAIARVNGLMYEPSYYALVVFPYFLLSFFLLNDERLNSKRNHITHCLFYCSAFSLILSSSRLALVAVMLAMPSVAIYRFIVLPSTRRYWKGDICRFIGFICVTVLFFIIVSFSVDYLAKRPVTQNTPQVETHIRQSVMNGTGIGGTADHSVSIRRQDMLDTVELASQHLWVGVGMGNVAKGIAYNKGISNPTSEDIRANEGLVPILEITAATGVVGIALFLGWLLWTTVPHLLKKPMTESELLKTGMCIAVLGQFLLMQGNQNILRMYFWVTLFILMIFNYAEKKKLRVKNE
ncbi:O-antigen ligase family protein [Halomonas sp. NPDC076908]|uniref:O-antigen ligase family protein n=1 Tax=Halomonas sp. NPDC076908 TaxID=3390567 RepID=UPI003CFE4EF1